jgi:ABC-type lipoprotein release transport system permease subunit
LRSATQQQVIIVAGICLPILLLFGLTNGHINELRSQLTKSPTGRQVKFGTTRSKPEDALTLKTIYELEKSIPVLEVLIPDIKKIVTLSSDKNSIESVTLFASRYDDPMLAYYGITIAPYTDAIPQIVISQAVADTLNVKLGDKITLQINQNTEDGKEQTVETKLEVSSIITLENEQSINKDIDDTKFQKEKAKNYTANVPFELLIDIERYLRGDQVLRYGWESTNPPPQDSYAGYLLFTKKNAPLLEKDIDKLVYKNLTVKEIDANDIFTGTLGGLLNDKALVDLLVYHLCLSGGENDEWGELLYASNDITRLTDIDDVVVAWNKPKKMNINSKEYIVLGVTLPNIWIKKYLRQKEFFTENENPYVVMFPNGEIKEKTVVTKSLKDSVPLTVKTVTPDAAADAPPKENIAVIPAKMLSYFYAHQRGIAVFDTIKKQFIGTPREPRYNDFYCYAKTIDDVPEVVRQLRNRYYSTTANETQIDEIRAQSKSLNLLVLIVGIGVFLFGVITVVVVLLDSTDRKRSIIGILRVMGVSKFGVFYIIFLRSVCIGILSVFVTIVFGYLLKSMLMGWNVHIIFYLRDVLVVSVGALCCCCLGTLLPAYKASKIDPFDAILEGRFR